MRCLCQPAGWFNSQPGRGLNLNGQSSFVHTIHGQGRPEFVFKGLIEKSRVVIPVFGAVIRGNVWTV